MTSSVNDITSVNDIIVLMTLTLVLMTVLMTSSVNDINIVLMTSSVNDI